MSLVQTGEDGVAAEAGTGFTLVGEHDEEATSNGVDKLPASRAANSGTEEESLTRKLGSEGLDLAQAGEHLDVWDAG